MASIWTRLVSDDLDNVRASGYTVMKASLVVYRNALFLFTYDLQSGDVWRSPDGEHWDPAAPGGWLSGNTRASTPVGPSCFAISCGPASSTHGGRVRSCSICRSGIPCHRCSTRSGIRPCPEVLANAASGASRPTLRVVDQAVVDESPLADDVKRADGQRGQDEGGRLILPPSSAAAMIAAAQRREWPIMTV